MSHKLLCFEQHCGNLLLNYLQKNYTATFLAFFKFCG